MDCQFIWAEYGSQVDPRIRDLMDSGPKNTLLTLDRSGPWHAGVCINEAVRAATGDLVVIIDGDIVAQPALLHDLAAAHAEIENLVCYVRRWDEPKPAAYREKSIADLEKSCIVTDAESYAACVSLRRATFESVGGMEEHPVFAGPGVAGKELFVRLRNAGYPIMWHPTQRIFHPWHPGAVAARNAAEQRAQAWVVRCRSLALDTHADTKQVDNYLKSQPEYHPQYGKKTVEGLKPKA